MNAIIRQLGAGLLLTGLALVPALSAGADLRVETEITYTAEIQDGELHLASELVMTNLTPDVTEGNQITRFFYDRIEIFVPETALNVVATSGGDELAVTLGEPDGEDGDGFQVAEIRFGRRIFYKQKLTLTLSYDIPGDPPRSETAFRVNPAYFSFSVHGWGDPGLVTVNVVTPSEFTIVLDGTEIPPEQTADGMSVFTVRDIQDLNDFFIHVRGWNDAALASRDLDVDGVDVIVRFWPGDDEWADEVAGTVEVGLPVLQSLVGLEWVTNRPLLISESLEVNLAGFGGWYLTGRNVIQIGEWVDPALVLHELSHAWFNSSLFTERWINEGLAEEFSTRAASATGLMDATELRSVTAPETTSLLPYLNDWVLPDETTSAEDQDRIDTIEEYGYDAAFWVVQEITAEIGPDSLAEVIKAAAGDEIAYRGEPVAETVAPQDDWSRFLDLLEEVGGSETAAGLFATFITDTDLTERAAAREDYEALIGHGGGWDLPFYVREPMSSWAFDTATARLAEAEEILVTRDQVEANLDSLGLTPTSTLEDSFEHATESMNETEELADAQLDATNEALEAKAAAGSELGFVERVGLLGADMSGEFEDVLVALEAEELETVASESSELDALVDGAGDRGRNRLLLGGMVVLLLGGGAVVLVRFSSGRSTD